MRDGWWIDIGSIMGTLSYLVRYLMESRPMLLVILKIQNISKSLQIENKSQMVKLWIVLAAQWLRFKIYTHYTSSYSPHLVIMTSKQCYLASYLVLFNTFHNLQKTLKGTDWINAGIDIKKRTSLRNIYCF